MTTVIGLFDTKDAADRAIEALKAAGFRPDELGVVAREPALAADVRAEEGARGRGRGQRTRRGRGPARRARCDGHPRDGSDPRRRPDRHRAGGRGRRGGGWGDDRGHDRRRRPPRTRRLLRRGPRARRDPGHGSYARGPRPSGPPGSRGERRRSPESRAVEATRNDPPPAAPRLTERAVAEAAASPGVGVGTMAGFAMGDGAPSLTYREVEPHFRHHWESARMGQARVRGRQPRLSLRLGELRESRLPWQVVGGDQRPPRLRLARPRRVGAARPAGPRGLARAGAVVDLRVPSADCGCGSAGVLAPGVRRSSSPSAPRRILGPVRRQGAADDGKQSAHQRRIESGSGPASTVSNAWCFLPGPPDERSRCPDLGAARSDHVGMCHDRPAGRAQSIKNGEIRRIRRTGRLPVS